MCTFGPQEVLALARADPSEALMQQIELIEGTATGQPARACRWARAPQRALRVVVLDNIQRSGCNDTLCVGSMI